MKSGLFEESLKSVRRAFEILEMSKVEFGNDVDVVRAKFYTLESNVNFVLQRYQPSNDCATAGLKHVA
jgi:hypothetical protein